MKSDSLRARKLGKTNKVAVTTLKSSDKSEATSPVVFWASEPIRPGETLMLVGGRFGKRPKVSFARLKDASTKEPSTAVASGIDSEDWRNGEISQKSDACLKVVIPEAFERGAFACRIVSEDTGRSTVVLLNRPRVWWTQGGGTLRSGFAGGPARVFGLCLDGGESPKALLRGKSDDMVTKLTIEDVEPNALSTRIPAKTRSGEYTLWVHNGFGGREGWVEAGDFTVIEPRRLEERVFNVLDYGARPNTNENCLAAVYRALQKAASLGGGVVYFPRGRYRIEANMNQPRLPGPLLIPNGVTLRGESMELVTLHWSDYEGPPLPALLQGSEHFRIENIALYCQGAHHNVITGIGRATVSRVRVRANCHYMTVEGSKPFHGRSAPEMDPREMGAAIFFQGGGGVRILDCDIYHSNNGIRLTHVKGAEIVGNDIRHGGNHLMVFGGEGIAFERNRCRGVNLRSFGGAWSTYNEAPSARNFYCAKNRFMDIYAGDRECFTFDGHGTAYYGKIVQTEGTSLILEDDPLWGHSSKDMLPDAHGTTLYVISGEGVGQCRGVISCNGRRVELDRPLDVVPDGSSMVSIGKFIGRLLYIGNEIYDAGSYAQLYPPNYECVVAANRSVRGGNLNSYGCLSLKMPWQGFRVEPSWFNQFLDNEVVEGNGWGGYESKVNDLLGGESCLDINGGDMLKHEETPPITRFQVVRRHRARNNSYIRVMGSSSDVIVEDCHVARNERGVQVGESIKAWSRKSLVFESDEKPSTYPGDVVLRRNKFEETSHPYVGNSLDKDDVMILHANAVSKHPVLSS